MNCVYISSCVQLYLISVHSADFDPKSLDWTSKATAYSKSHREFINIALWSTKRSTLMFLPNRDTTRFFQLQMCLPEFDDRSALTE